MALISFFSGGLIAQQSSVAGTVTDDSGLPLPGATVVVENTNRGVTTDFDGNFSINAQNGEVLIVSYVGYQNSRITVGNQSNYNISLQTDNALEEVVVTTAFGTQRKISIVGTIATITNETIDNVQATSVIGSIQGSVPGVNILTAGGVPGTNPTIWIRGTSSVNADPNPLYILDGAPYIGNTNIISQSQIGSISILKDASATALYGARGANGVVIINTRRGRYNKEPEIHFNSVTGVSDNAIPFHQILGNQDYMELTWEALRNAKTFTQNIDSQNASIQATADLIPHLGYNPYNIDNPIDTNGKLKPDAQQLWESNWRDALLRKQGIRSEHALSITGGGEKTSYFMNINYLKEDGQVKTTHFERSSARATHDTKIKDWLRFGNSISITTSNQSIPNQEGTAYQSAIQWIYSLSSIYPLYRRDDNGVIIRDNSGNPIYDYGNNNGNVNAIRPVFGGENVAGSLQYYEFKNERNSATYNGYLEIDFLRDFTFRSTNSYEKYFFDLSQYTHYKYGFAGSVGGRVSENEATTTSINSIQKINYTKTFNKHSIDADAIYEAYDVKTKSIAAQGTGFLPGVKVLSGSTNPESVSGQISQERIVGLLGRLRYNYDDIYFAEATYRRDASTRFKKENRWGDFYALGAAYMISNSNFFKIDAINYLKLKASFGVLGNNRGIGLFPYLQLFETGWNQLSNTGVIAQGLRDPNIRWEKTSSFNAGFEISMWNNRLQAEINYYDKNSVDLIFDKPLAPSTGNTSISTNEGSLRNYGLEVSLGGTLMDKEGLFWDIETNFSLDKNKITKLTQDEIIRGNKKWVVGKSLYDFFIREYAGVDPEDGSAMWYKDVVNEDGEPTGQKETTKNYSDATRYFNGKTSIPDIVGGFSSRLLYKNFDLSFRFNFSLGAHLYDTTYAALMNSMDSPGSQGHQDLINRWQKPGDVTDVPKLLAANNDYNSRSTRFLFKNDYLRLKDIAIGYNIDSDLLDKMGMNKFRIFLRGNNIFTFQSVKGVDAEQSINGSTNSRSYALKTISMGLEIKM